MRAKFKKGTLVAAVFLMSASFGSMWQDYDDVGVSMEKGSPMLANLASHRVPMDKIRICTN